MDLDKKYIVKYTGENKDILKHDIRCAMIEKGTYSIPKKHFWSKQKDKTIYEVRCICMDKKLGYFPESYFLYLSSLGEEFRFDTFEAARKFFDDNFVLRNNNMDYWDDIILTPRYDMFKPILHDKSGKFILLEDTLTQNVYIAVNSGHTVISIAPYYNSKGQIMKAREFNPSKVRNVSRFEEVAKNENV